MSLASRFRGIVPAVATPFDTDQNVDLSRLSILIDDYIAAGVHGISVAGSQGEFFALTDAERIAVIETAVRAVDGRVPLYVGSGGISTAGSIALTQAAEAAGADVAMLITPYFISPTADEVVDHFQTIARATALPILIYSNPPRTHLDVAPESFRRMAEADNIIGIKDSSGDMTQMIEYLRVTDGEKLVFAGRDTLIQASLQQGITGAISPGANVFPSAFVQLHDLVTAGEHDRARALSNLLAPLRIAWSLGSFPVVIKEAMALVGRDAGSARKPIHPLTPENRAKLRTIIERIQHDLR